MHFEAYFVIVSGVGVALAQSVERATPREEVRIRSLL